MVKHAGRAHTTVLVGYRPDALELIVTDTGDGAAAPVPAPGGHGLVGMRERAAVFGGSLTAGPRADHGFEVHAVLALRRTGGRMSSLRVVIADDQPMMRAGFRAVLEATGNIEVVAEAGNGEEAVAAATKHAPDVVLMDIRMPVMDGIEATRRLPRQRVLILTTFGLDEYIIDALRAGASGFLLKDAPTDEVVQAVRAVAAGDAVLAPAVTRQLLDQVGRRLPAAVSRTPDEIAQVTEREQQVLRMLAAGLTNAEISAAMFLSETTVKTHVRTWSASSACATASKP